MDNRKRMRALVEKCMKKHDIIWTANDATVRELGDILLKYKHVMQLMELIEFIPAFPKINFLRINAKKYAQHAWKVVVPETNRAYIQKTWWELETLPTVLPNKPYHLEEPEITSKSSEYIKKLSEEKRRVLLYQGVFMEDRNLEAYARATGVLKDKYCMYIMGEDSDYRKKLCKKFPHIEYIPFIAPPDHLAVTKHADVGITPYVAKHLKGSNHSVLNAMYCAPNKIYEYAAYGLPMIGSDVLGLKEPFVKYNIGVTCKGDNVEEIVEKLKYIDDNYDEMSKNCAAFYNDIDLDKIVHDILYDTKVKSIKTFKLA